MGTEGRGGRSAVRRLTSTSTWISCRRQDVAAVVMGVLDTLGMEPLAIVGPAVEDDDPEPELSWLDDEVPEGFDVDPSAFWGSLMV